MQLLRPSACGTALGLEFRVRRNPARARRVPFFVMRRIIEGLGLGLARWAARKLVPRKLSRRRLKLPRQPGRGASLALASVILALGAGPLGFPKQLSGRRLKLPRQPWQTRAVAHARSVILALGAGPSGFPRQFSGRRPKLLRQPPSRSLPSFWRWGLAGRASRNKFPSGAKRRDVGRAVAAMAVLSTRSRQISKFGLRMADFILSRIRSLSAVKPSHFYQGLAELQFYQGRPAAVAVLSRRVARARFRNFGAGSWPAGLLETIVRAIPRRRSRALRCSSARGWPVGLPETIFRATANFCDSLPRARFRYFGAGGWPDGLPETSFRAMKAEGSWNASGRNGRFINQKRTSGQISKFGLRMADFILSRIRSLSAAKPSHFYQGLAEGQLYQGRPAAVAVYQSRWQFYHSLWPFYQPWPLFQIEDQAVAVMAVLSIRSVQMARSVDLGWQNSNFVKAGQP